MSNRREKLASRRDQVGQSATPVVIPTAHLERVNTSQLDVQEDVIAFWVPLRDIRSSPFQYRYDTSPGPLRVLADSIARQELYQPITLRPASGAAPGQYEVVLGHRRLAAFALLGRATIPAIVRDYSDAQAMRALLEENLKRENVNLFEQTEGTVQLIALETGRIGAAQQVVRTLLNEMLSRRRASGTSDFQEEPYATVQRVIAEVTGLSWSTFHTNRMSVYRLPAPLLDEVRGGMPYSLALAVQRLSPAVQVDALAFLRQPGGTWASREELKVWADAELDAPAATPARLKRILASARKTSLTPADQKRIHALLTDLERLFRLN